MEEACQTPYINILSQLFSQGAHDSLGGEAVLSQGDIFDSFLKKFQGTHSVKHFFPYL